MQSPKPLIIAAALLAILALAAPVLAGIPEPCSLITKEEAEAILGEAVKAPRTGKVVGMAEGVKCEYFTAAPIAKRGGTGMVKLTMFTKDTLGGGLFSSPENYFERRFKASNKAGAKLEEISGLGEQAYWDSKSNVLHILAKDMYLLLSVIDLKKIKVKGGMDDLRKAVSERRKKLTIDAAQKYIMPRL